MPIRAVSKGFIDIYRDEKTEELTRRFNPAEQREPFSCDYRDGREEAFLAPLADTGFLYGEFAGLGANGYLWILSQRYRISIASLPEWLLRHEDVRLEEYGLNSRQKMWVLFPTEPLLRKMHIPERVRVAP